MVRATAPPQAEVYEVDETDESEVIEGGDGEALQNPPEVEVEVAENATP
jgi:hypothetical protein